MNSQLTVSESNVKIKTRSAFKVDFSLCWLAAPFRGFGDMLFWSRLALGHLFREERTGSITRCYSLCIVWSAVGLMFSTRLLDVSPMSLSSLLS